MFFQSQYFCAGIKSIFYSLPSHCASIIHFFNLLWDFPMYFYSNMVASLLLNLTSKLSWYRYFYLLFIFIFYSASGTVPRTRPIEPLSASQRLRIGGSLTVDNIWHRVWRVPRSMHVKEPLKQLFARVVGGCFKAKFLTLPNISYLPVAVQITLPSSRWPYFL